MFGRPPIFLYPCVVYSFLGYAVSLVLTVSVNILNPFVLQAPPYNWSLMINGLVNIPGFIGNVTQQGVFEPESRLYLCAISLSSRGQGASVWIRRGEGATLDESLLRIRHDLVCVNSSPTITIAYVWDRVLPVNSDDLMLANGSKNTVAFGFLYGIVPWVEKVGYVDCFATQASVSMAVIGVGMAWLTGFVIA
ncbi:hypothetical protein C8A03DRAFT_31470 [Achaetomium macrosporum]|uniref:Uncharacterized protein n=1 Tax=Achaetomium macrosporum TaxID=79813 RepID=A0AAN7CE83_9PEZI|nr:hypothetical protein C8A03DRAFT_31470 [Achaetomium macrosporum]